MKLGMSVFDMSLHLLPMVISTVERNKKLKM